MNRKMYDKKRTREHLKVLRCQCGNEAEGTHKCPYNEELGDGCKDCNCCSECEAQCAADI